MRVYTKKTGSKPDLSQPVVLSADRGGTTIKSLCNQLHKELTKEFNYALVWGISSKHYPQRCGLTHDLHDEDVVQIVKQKKSTSDEGKMKKVSEPDKISDRVKKAPLKS